MNEKIDSEKSDINRMNKESEVNNILLYIEREKRWTFKRHLLMQHASHVYILSLQIFELFLVHF